MKPTSRILTAGPRRLYLIGRGLADESDRPLVAGIALGLLSTIETVIRTDGSMVIRPIAMVLGLAATLPLAFATRFVVPAAATITTATFLTALVYRWGPTVTGVVALLALWLPLVHQRARRRRAEAAERDTAREEMEHRLLELTARSERARIARELHDVVAHHISMISVQAEAARLTSPGMPEEGAMRLRAIGDTARTALTEMRRLLGVLREDTETEPPTRQPQPGLQQLLDLIDETRASTKVSTRLIVRGEIVLLDPGVELTAYRIVQEALTNARKHAPGAAIDVEIRYTDDWLHVRVRDLGPGPVGRTKNGGYGLLGMRERVAAVGGRLRTGPAPGSGFLVEAALPATRPVGGHE
ncbi:sensor histidine kinase [Sphaerisporangium aureirubrum]|uniref:histidine kinase n=1 Tax=Sphaerisporangium aureirubrum TaxID=1544736 RepID=A0ABW1NJ25_9ACTN